MKLERLKNVGNTLTTVIVVKVCTFYVVCVKFIIRLKFVRGFEHVFLRIWSTLKDMDQYLS